MENYRLRCQRPGQRLLPNTESHRNDQTLGVTGYFLKIIRNYAFIAQPLSAALRKTKPKEIISEREKAFDMLKKALWYVCHLTIPMPKDTYFVYIDASFMGIGGVLNVSREGQELSIAFFSRELHSSENNYSSSEIECLAVVDKIRQFEIHLVGNHSLLWLITRYFNILLHRGLLTGD